MNFELLIVTIIVAAFSYYLGQAKTVREKKLELYQKALPWLVNATMGNKQYSGDHIERHFNFNVRQIWLFGNRQVAFAVDKLCSVIVDQSRGDIIECLQEVISAMRNDIQIGFRYKINVTDIKHIHMIFNKTELQKDNKVDV